MNRMEPWEPRDVLVVAALFLVLLMLGGCVTQQSLLINPHQGRDGITIEFLPNMPADEVYEGPVYLGMKLSNKGAIEVQHEHGFLSLALENDYLGFTSEGVQVDDQHATFVSPEKAKFNLIGKTKFDPIGEDTLITLQLQTKQLDPQLETITTNILATICYDYETQATANVCIDTDPNNMRLTEKVCQQHDVSLSDQGAPVAVTHVAQSLLTGIGDFIRSQFIITVQNVGNGQPLKPGAAETACGSGPIGERALATQPKKAFNAVKLNDISFGGYSLSNGQLECSPVTSEGTFVVLENGQGTIKCTLKGGLIKQTQESFLTNLYVDLGYAYTTTASRQVRIRKTG